jgi:YVTN family beta-propeller protein
MVLDADVLGGGLSLGMLGPLMVERSGEPVPLGGRQQRAVLAFLLTRGGKPVGMSGLADALWGGRVPAGAAQTVQTYVSHLRDALEPGRDKSDRSRYIRTEHDGYRLVLDSDWVDAVAFEDRVMRGLELIEQADFGAGKSELTAALALWRGEVLADLADYEFVAPVAARYSELRAVATEALIDARLELGEHRSLIPELDTLIAADPLRERMHGQRMLALYRAGRQSDALAGYRTLHALLDEELGIEPSRPIQQLHASILAQDPALDWRPPPRPIPKAAASGTPVARSPRPRRRVVWVAAGIALMLAVMLTATVVRTTLRSTLTALPANGIGMLHPDGTMTDGLPTGLVPEAIAYGAGSLWVANREGNTVVRVDPKHHRIIQTIPVPGKPTALTVTGRDVWVASFEAHSVSRINVDSTTVVRTIPVGTQPAAIASDETGVWVANSGDNTIQRIDPVTSKPDPAIPVGNGPDGLALDDQTIWVANARDNTVTHLYTATGREASAGVPVGSGPRGILLAAGSVWVANSLSQSVSQIDRATNNVTTTRNVGDGPAALAATMNTIWVANEFDGTVARIDAGTSQLKGRSFSVGASPRAMATAAGKLWIAAVAFAGHIGGTLTIATPALPGDFVGIDPSGAYLGYSIEAERLVYDGLVALRNVGALSGSTLVPDLAVAIPAPTDHGLTYTFTLRKGIRYSDGTSVRASDFVLGLRRALLEGNPAFFQKIKGAGNCAKHPKRCDLSHGITADDPASAVTFHLAKPDPELLYELTLFVYPMPPGTPLTRMKTPIPGTGPYKIVGYRERKPAGGDIEAVRFDLVRNPYFRQWSYAAQQRGFVDRIHYQREDVATAERLVEQDKADLVQLTDSPYGRLPPGLLDSVHDRFPTRLHSQERPITNWVVLNTRLAPFNDPKAREAFSYAVDREEFVRGKGGVPTCQILPRDFPGYQPYCPYSVNPGNPEYHAPDLATARRLVEKSRTSGMHVTVHGLAKPSWHVTALFLKSVLTEIGYNADIKEYQPSVEGLAPFGTPHHKAQVSFGGWEADFPLPSNFYYNRLDCASAALSAWSSATACDAALDAAARKAVALEASNPSAAIRLWADIDHKLVDLSFVVPLSNDATPIFVSSRVGNYQSSQFNGPVLSQLWVNNRPA